MGPAHLDQLLDERTVPVIVGIEAPDMKSNIANFDK